MSASQVLSHGAPAPLGATCIDNGDSSGVNFAVSAAGATQVELCVFNDGNERRFSLPVNTNGVWHGFLPGVQAGTVYGFRVHGDYDPTRGLRFNPNKLLVDPYAKVLQGKIVPDASLRDGYLLKGKWQRDPRDNASFVPRGVVYDREFDWRDTRRPHVPMSDSIIYELHVKGFTQRHPGVPAEKRGKYLGLAEPVILEYLSKLGITAIELLPCASFLSEEALLNRGLSNYWGYNPIGFFAPHRGYAINDPVSEFQTMVRAMHSAGIEVILDVVYNHTAEGGADGPMLSFRGIDNSSYYQLRQNDPASYVNNTGCGNTFAVDNPVAMKLVMDSLRYWVEVMGVDGFRFDLATALARVNGEYDESAPFLQAVYQDPVLSRCKLIAEPWDVGHAGYRLGGFPAGWSEWNDRYRHTMRSFWRGDAGKTGEFASRLAGSEDIFGARAPGASINYLCAHDGFTLQDLVSYQVRHNEANGEDNADGDRASDSWNNGVEGPTENPGILKKRDRDKRALLTSLLVSQGIPMLLAGDEMGRTQHGNNNAYCQDNETSWLDWEHADESLISFVSDLITLRREHAVLRRQTPLSGQLVPEHALHDVQWFRADGSTMQSADWSRADSQGLAVLLHANRDADMLAPQYRVASSDVLILINGRDEPLEFNLQIGTDAWHVVLGSADGARMSPETYRLQAKSVVVFTTSNN